MSTPPAPEPLNAFCVDLEEWFHVCGVTTDFSDPSTWSAAPEFVTRNVDTLMRLLDETRTRGTFLTVGWVAERYPQMMRRLVDAGHEIGCHTYWHRLIYSVSADEFEADIARCLKVLREVSGQPVTAFRAPSFSMKTDCFWAYPVLRRHGITVDVSIVPASRADGGIDGFVRDPFLLRTSEGTIKCFPVSVMTIAGKTVPFSGGGYLRLLPSSIINAGYRQNHREGRPGMSYIHPREIDPTQPRLKLPWKKYFKYYVNIAGTEQKLRTMLKTFRFTTVAEVLAAVTQWPEYELSGAEIRPVSRVTPSVAAGV